MQSHDAVSNCCGLDEGKASTLTGGNEGTPKKKRSRVVVVKIISLSLIEWMDITHVYD